MKTSHLGLAIVFLASLLALPAFAAEEITLDSLLNEMINRENIARLPDPTYTCRQESSYDRKSVAPGEDGWFANNDHSQYLRGETIDGRDEWVMLDAKGPGAIVRFWVTSGAYVGNIRFYLDGSDVPAITGKVDDLIGGDALVASPLSAERARGRNLFLPIPYARSCKITFDRPDYWQTKEGEDRLYYNINYRTYEAGTQMRSFTMADLKKQTPLVAKVNVALLNPDNLNPTTRDGSTGTRRSSGKGISSQIMTSSGPRVMRRLSVRLQADDLDQALRSTVLSIKFDGEQTVWCPVGDFFGSGVGLNPYKGWWREVRKDGEMICYWPMPFEKSMEAKLVNLSDQAIEQEMEGILTEWDWDDRSMHFRANWRHSPAFTSTRELDWNFITAKGKGVLVGDTLAIANHDQAWWGEGDEKIFVDGEAFPSHIGTGTEDYYGYAWCTPAFFEAPFHAQPRVDGPRNFGHTTNTRSRVLDAIPFTKSIQFDMEAWHWATTKIAYSGTTYWYARPGATSNRPPSPEAAKAPIPDPNAIKRIEGEALQLRLVTHGRTEIQAGEQYGWSGNQQLWWKNNPTGAQLGVAFNVDRPGEYAIRLRACHALDYATAQFSIGDQKLGNPIDFYQKDLKTKVVDLGTVELEEGEHTLTATLVKPNPKAIQSNMLGIDYIEVERK